MIIWIKVTLSIVNSILYDILYVESCHIISYLAWYTFCLAQVFIYNHQVTNNPRYKRTLESKTKGLLVCNKLNLTWQFSTTAMESKCQKWVTGIDGEGRSKEKVRDELEEERNNKDWKRKERKKKMIEIFIWLVTVRGVIVFFEEQIDSKWQIYLTFRIFFFL